ncbi:MAG: PfkB family carbohydrate kinase [Puniceicoccales bacterium]|jgi:D-beta-D-heptose 7-phosphate kinase/D-beta-D-heptose 1-phosphate adenosyltransferase|nr:PfkB family carbohydrate kinase [Puniceicoccales bacterium]
MEALSKIFQHLSKIHMLVVGDVMLDHYISGDVFRISPEAPVPVISVEEERYVLGAAANVAHNLASLGVQTKLLGTWGKDFHGTCVEQLLQQVRITAADGSSMSGVQTILKTRIVARQQQLCRLDREDLPSRYQKAFAHAAAVESLERALAYVDAIIISDYAKGVVDQGIVDHLAHYAQEHHKILAWDPKPSHELNFSYLTLMTPNRQEAFALANMPEDHRHFPKELICKKIFQRYHPQYLVITLGKDGMLLSCDGNIVCQMPTCAREVFDVSGAGDTVVAMLAAALAAQVAPEDAMHLANMAAGIVVTKQGTAVVTAKEIMERAFEV